MIGVQLNFTRETGTFKTVVFVDDTGEVFEKFDAGKESGVYDYFYFNDVGSVEGYREYIGAIENAGNSLFGSNVWRKARPAINFFYQSQAVQRQIDVFEYLQDLFPHYYSFTFDVGGEISERVHYENNLLDATYNVASQLIQTNTFNSGHPENEGFFCAGGACNCSITLDLAADGSSAATLVTFPIFPKTVINRDGTITIGKAARVLRTQIGFVEDRRSNYRNVSGRISIVEITNVNDTFSDIGFFSNIKGKMLTGDPYNDGDGITETGGGTGTFDGSSDVIGSDPLPSLSVVDTGFITLYNPSLSQLQNLASFMWSSAFDIDSLKKIFANPIDTILSCAILPVSVPNTGARNLKIGNIDSGIPMYVASAQWITTSCGSLNMQEFWGAYLDYAPYTEAEIFLPYIGIEKLSIDDIMGKTVTVQYKTDILTGACVCEILCNGSVTYTFTGSMAYTIPITGNDFRQVFSSILSIAASGIGLAVSGGMSAPLAVNALANISSNAMNAKPRIDKSGSVSGSAGILAKQTPYMILTRPRQAVAFNENRYTGYPSHITGKLSDFHGFTQFEKVILDGIDASDSELKEIERLLQEGVYLP